MWNCVTALLRCGAVLAAAMGSASAHRTVDLLLCSSVVRSIPSAKRLSDCRCVRFDKLNLIIGADGVAATVFEHSPVDGHTMLPFVDVQPRNCCARRRLTVWSIFRLARHAAGYSVELCGHFAAVACRPCSIRNTQQTTYHRPYLPRSLSSRLSVAAAGGSL